MTKAVIIGAGAGGLATANILAQAGVDVTVLEQRATPGGRMGMLAVDGFRFDTGPSWYLMPEVFEHYFALFNKQPSDYFELVRLQPGYQVTFAHGKTVPVYADRLRDSRMLEQLESGSSAALARYLDTAGLAYRVAHKYFLYNNFQSIRSVLHPEILRATPTLIGAVMRTLHGNITRYFQTLEVQQLLEYHAVFLGASPFKAPALYSLMSHLDFAQGVYYPQGGMHGITEALVSLGEELGVEHRYNVPVKRIRIRNGVATGVQLADGTKIDADIVISNADLQYTETTLVPPAYRTYPAAYWRTRIAGPSAILMYLGVRGNLPNMTHHNLFFVDNWQENFQDIFDKKVWPDKASMYVCVPSKTDPSVAPAGHENVFVLVPSPAVGTISQKQLDTLAERYLDQLIEVTGVQDLRTRIVSKTVWGPQYFTDEFHAWQGTALGLSHTLKQSAMFRPRNASKRVAGLYYVGGNTVPGVGVPMCLIGAELIYKRLQGDASGTAIDSIEPLRAHKGAA